MSLEAATEHGPQGNMYCQRAVMALQQAPEVKMSADTVRGTYVRHHAVCCKPLGFPQTVETNVVQLRTVCIVETL